MPLLIRLAVVAGIRLRGQDAVQIVDDAGNETLVGRGVWRVAQELAPVGALEDCTEQEGGGGGDVGVGADAAQILLGTQVRGNPSLARCGPAPRSLSNSR